MKNSILSTEKMLIVAEIDPADRAGPEKLLAFAARLDEVIKTDPAASQLSDGVIYRVDAQQRKFIEQVVVPSALFYLDDAAFAAARQRLTREQMIEQLRRNE